MFSKRFRRFYKLTKELLLQAVKAVIYQDGKFLLQHRDNDPTIFHPGKWGLFGGSVDKGETLEEALVRELKEEINWSPDLSHHKLLFGFELN